MTLPVLLSFSVLLLSGLCVILYHYIPIGPYFHKSGNFVRYFSWDAGWYANVAADGYVWHGFHADPLGHYQNVVFYPLWPLIERVVLNVFGGLSKISVIIISALFGILSIFAFKALAGRIFENDGHKVMLATVAYAFWPGACFFVMGYPTGLTNLCVIAALYFYTLKQKYKAAFWVGVGTASAPTMVFVAAALCLDFFAEEIETRGIHDRRFLKIMVKIVPFGMLSVSGLLLFMLFLYREFHNPLLFLKAQQAWVPPISLTEKIRSLLSVGHYVAPVRNFFVMMYKGVVNGKLQNIQFRGDTEILYQKTIDILLLILSSICIWFVYKTDQKRLLILVVACNLIGYIWFMGVGSVDFLNGVRMLYVAVPIFLGFAVFADTHRYWGAVLIGASGLLLMINELAVLGGYIVI